MAGRRAASAAERRERRGAIDDANVVMEAAAAFLAVRPRSVSETRRRLRHLGYRHELVDEVVARLVEMGYLDDAEFARAWLESRDRARPRGAAALRRELGLKGIEREVVDAALGDRSEAAEAAGDDADAAGAGRLLERKRPALKREPDPRKRRQKAYGLLARHGFDPDSIRTAIDAWEAAPGESHDA
jgi:regulatory protein